MAPKQTQSKCSSFLGGRNTHEQTLHSHSNANEPTVTSCTKEMSPSNICEWKKKADTKEKVLYDFIYINYKSKSQKSESSYVWGSTKHILFLDLDSGYLCARFVKINQIVCSTSVQNYISMAVNSYRMTNFYWVKWGLKKINQLPITLCYHSLHIFKNEQNRTKK